MKRVVLIDGQVFQSGAWHRGMGKYSFELLKASARSLRQKNDKVMLLINKNLEIEETARKALDDIFGSKNIIRLNLVQAGRDVNKDRSANKRILNKYIATKFLGHEVKYLILSLFLDNGCAVFPDKSSKFLLFYDSIPFLYPDKYQNRINYDNYLTHYATVFEADKIFAISQTVADDTVLGFGIDESKLVNIDGARIGVPSDQHVMPSTLEGVGKFILCPTGDELRKNNLRAVQGFELFNQRNNNTYKLVLTSFFSEYTIQQLNAVSENIIFTHNVPFNELEWLYTNAELLLFPSEYEGLGLPILEAVTYGKKIACSDIPVFREISEDAFYYFDPLNPVDIAQKLSSASAQSQKSNPEKYKKIAKKYTWERTGRLLADTITTAQGYRQKDHRPKLAILSPSPDGYSAIGKVVAESHASLSVYFDITYYFEKGPEHRYLRPDFLSKVAKNHPIKEFTLDAYKGFDAVLYHIGNSEYHLATIANALVYPGYCIFHDTNLGGAFGLLRKLGYISNDRYLLEEGLDKIIHTKRGKFLGAVAANQRGVFTHSKYAKKAIEETIDPPEVIKLELPVDVPKLDRHYRVEDGAVTRIGLAGIIAGIKGIELIEELSNNLGSQKLDIRVFGYLQSDEIRNQLKRLTNVTLVTNPTDFEFQNLLAGLDILLNYRMQYQGETSLTVLEAMRHGIVVVVRDVGWYAELPDDAVVKVKSPEAALATIAELSQNKKMLQTISSNAKQYIRDNHTHLTYANEIYGVITKLDTSRYVEQVADLIKNENLKKKRLKRALNTIYRGTGTAS